ncbi:hypothetical protein HK101_003634 [Irineochytrium annulatum]|nr:hypothetical protein HK101_003634 [Irineochytrium annulatum]
MDGSQGNHTTVLSCNALVTCLGDYAAEKGAGPAHIFDLQVVNMTVQTSASMEEMSTAGTDDAEFANAFRFVRANTGQVTSVLYAPSDAAMVIQVKKAITEAFSTNFAYSNGTTSVPEVGVTASRNAEYSAVSYDGHYKINACYDDTNVMTFAPGASMPDGAASYMANTDALVDSNGLLKNSFDRTHVLPGTSAYNADATGPAMNVHASADCVYIQDVPRVAITDPATLSDPEPLLASAAPTTPVTARRSAAADAADLQPHLDALSVNPSSAKASRALHALVSRNPHLASKLLSIARRAHDTHLSRRSAHELAHERNPMPIFAALAASGDEDAQMHLVEAAATPARGEAGRVVRAGARIGLNFAEAPSERVMRAFVNVSLDHGAEAVMTLGSLLSHLSDAEDAARIMGVHLDRVRRAGVADGETMLVLLGVGNMRRNSAALVQDMMSIARDATRSVRVRVGAVEALRGCAGMQGCRDAMSKLYSGSEMEIRLAILRVAGTAAKSNRKLRKSAMDALDAVVLSTFDVLLDSAVATYVDDRFDLMHHDARGRRRAMKHGRLERRAPGPAPVVSTQWDSAASPAFELVEPLAARQGDIVQFPLHAAGLVGEFLGWDQFSIQAGLGGYAGIGADGCHLPAIKVLGHLQAAVSIFGHLVSVLDGRAEVLHAVTPKQEAAASLHVTLLGVSIFAKDYDFTCETWSWPLASMTVKIINFNYDIPIYIGTISVSVSVGGTFDATLSLQVCAAPSAKLSFQPSIEADAIGSGGLSLWLVRGALNLKGTSFPRPRIARNNFFIYQHLGSIKYFLGPELRALDPADGCKACLSLSQGWTPATIVLSASVDGRWTPFSSWKTIKSWDLYSWNIGAGRPSTPIDGLNYCFAELPHATTPAFTISPVTVTTPALPKTTAVEASTSVVIAIPTKAPVDSTTKHGYGPPPIPSTTAAVASSSAGTTYSSSGTKKYGPPPPALSTTTSAPASSAAPTKVGYNPPSASSTVTSAAAPVYTSVSSASAAPMASSSAAPADSVSMPYVTAFPLSTATSATSTIAPVVSSTPCLRETDPDFVNDVSEKDQRWGNQKTAPADVAQDSTDFRMADLRRDIVGRNETAAKEDAKRLTEDRRREYQTPGRDQTTR